MMVQWYKPGVRQRTGIGIALVAGLLGIVTFMTPVAASNTVTQKIKPGTLSASIADATLSDVSYSHAAQTNTGTLTLTADDSSGSNQGWKVTVQASDFVYTDGSGHTLDSIPAANFSVTGYGTVSVIAGQNIHATKGPNVGTTGPLDAAIKVLSANPGFGKGTYSVPINVSLQIPGQTLAGDYRSTLTVSITAGP